LADMARVWLDGASRLMYVILAKRNMTFMAFSLAM